MPSTRVTLKRRGSLAVLLGAMCLVVPVAFAQESIPILGTDESEIVTGTAGDDALYGRAGNDTLAGLAGNDDLDGGLGADLFSGGDGNDVVSYEGTVGVTVTLDGTANDGAPGEGDNVGQDVEDVFGTDGDDKLTGSSASNMIDGRGGGDNIDGAGGTDVILGDTGDDFITTRDGKRDHVDCGPGQDRAVIDRIDTTKGCENVEVSAITPPFILAGFPTRSRSRLASIRLVGVLSGSRLVVACRSGCRPATPRTRRLVTRQSASVNGGQVVLRLPGRPAIVGGTTFEVGVTARRAAHGRCNVYRVGRRFRGLPLQRSRSCTSAARTR